MENYLLDEKHIKSLVIEQVNRWIYKKVHNLENQFNKYAQMSQFENHVIASHYNRLDHVEIDLNPTNDLIIILFGYKDKTPARIYFVDFSQYEDYHSYLVRKAKEK